MAISLAFIFMCEFGYAQIIILLKNCWKAVFFILKFCFFFSKRDWFEHRDVTSISQLSFCLLRFWLSWLRNYSPSLDRWNFKWTEFRWIHANFSFEIPSLVTQTVPFQTIRLEVMKSHQSLKSCIWISKRFSHHEIFSICENINDTILFLIILKSKTSLVR